MLMGCLFLHFNLIPIYRRADIGGMKLWSLTLVVAPHTGKLIKKCFWKRRKFETKRYIITLCILD